VTDPDDFMRSPTSRAIATQDYVVVWRQHAKTAAVPEFPGSSN